GSLPSVSRSTSSGALCWAPFKDRGKSVDSTSVGGQRAESRERPRLDREFSTGPLGASTRDDGALESVREAVAGRLRQGSWREALAECRERAPSLVAEVVDQAGN